MPDTEQYKPKQKQFSDVVGEFLAKIESEEENFADLLKVYDNEKNIDIRVGNQITGKIISIGRDAVFVDIGAKIDGFVDKAELIDESGALPYQVGDTIDLYVMSYKESEIRLSKAISSYGGLSLLEEASKSGIPVEGKVKEVIKGGFHVDIMQRRAFCPTSQMELRFIQNPEQYVGQTFQFLIKRIEDKGNNIVVSRRDLLEAEAEKEKQKLLETVTVDSVLEGKVTRLLPHGAVVELFPGVEGMIHLSELSWGRLEKPEDAVKEGDLVNVKVLRIEDDSKSKSLKISLSIKQILGDPWNSVLDTFHIGDRVSGKVRGFLKSGVFVELIPGIDGFVHVSEMSYKKRVTRPEDVVQIGDKVDVLIKDIDPDRRRISLSIKEAEGDPWIRIHEKYQVSQAVEGILEKKESFGYFVTLEPGITGLLPKSKIKQSRLPSAIEKLHEGEPITVIIQEIKASDRKITLGPGDAEEADDWRQYARHETRSLGTFGDKLQKALNKQKNN